MPVVAFFLIHHLSNALTFYLHVLQNASTELEKCKLNRDKHDISCLMINYEEKTGARDRNRTGTAVRPGDFKSPVSTNSTTRAQAPILADQTGDV